MDILLSPSGLLVVLTIFFVGAFGSLFLARFLDDGGRWAGLFAHGAAFLGSFLSLLIATKVLLTGQGIAFILPGVFPGILDFDFRMDGLAAFFFGLIALIALVSSLYGFSYQKHFIGSYNLGRLGFFYNGLIVSLLLVTLANQALFFLLAWECMSLASYFLVVYEYRKQENIRAGFLYFLMTHIGTLFISLSFLLAYQATGSFEFDAWRAAAGTVSPLLQTAILLCALMGFGIKAGIIPVHIWLPGAHSAAPTHVSALLSGVMIKTAIFMFIRFFFEFFPGAPLEWGLVFLVLGSVSSLLGVLYALSEHDIKKLLAYHSIENIGIILLGIGAGITFFALGLETFALFALAAALYHTMNHAIFKALLFLGAGSVVATTGTRNMEAYGGLIRVMPMTAFFFLIGSLAISAFPPFNGFASEWLTFQALFVGISSASILVKTVFIFSIGSLAFTGGLAAACFVKAFGTTFLARPRSINPKPCHESGTSMLIAMGILAVLTVVLGVFSTIVIASLVAIIASIGLIDPLTLEFPFTQFIEAREQFASVLPLDMVALALILGFAFVAGAVFWGTRSRKVVVGDTWDCGTPPTMRTEMTATSFSRALVTIFRGILRPTKQTAVEYHDEHMRYFITAQEVTTALEDPYRKLLYAPLQQVVHFLASKVRHVHGGNINMYILYIFITLIALLFWTTRK
ncbi:MAG: hydrogenase 4 subunit B [Candidatus Moranbacteria bacterium]|nr:hydrogenase 4 subunit B [Candidatus Moranbacteria bacterium]